MAKYIGFSTQGLDEVRRTQTTSGVDGGAGSITNPVNPTRKFRLLDQELVIRDLLNALNTPQGQLPGKPEYGTNIWNFIFEPNVFDVQTQLEEELKRVISLDPRLILNYVTCYPTENGILIELEIAVSLFNDPIQLSILFDKTTSTALSS
jgi:phage baseplate assembly protein W